MAKNLPEIDKLIRDGIHAKNGHSDPAIWLNIEQQLDQDDAVFYKARFVRLKGWFGSLLMVLFVLLVFTLIHFNSAEYKKTVIENKISANKQPATNKELHTLNQGNESVTIKNPSAKPDKLNLSNWPDDFHSLLIENNITADKNSHPREKPIAEFITGNPISHPNHLFSNEPGNETLATHLSQLWKPKENASFHMQLINIREKDTGIFSVLISNFVKAGIDRKMEWHTALLPGEKNAQVTNGNKMKRPLSKNPFYVNAFFAPEYTGYILENDETTAYDSKEKIRGRENNEFSFSTGFIAGYQFKEHWSVESGFSFSSSNISIDESKIFAERNTSGDIKFRYNTSSGYTYFLPAFNSTPALGDSLSTSTSNLLLQYLNVPLSLRYHVKKGNLRLGMAAGITLHLLTRAVVQTEIENQQHAETEIVTHLAGMRSVHPSMQLSPQIDFKMSKQFEMNVRPYFNYSLAPVNKGNIVKTYAYNLGLATGFTYRF